MRKKGKISTVIVLLLILEAASVPALQPPALRLLNGRLLTYHIRVYEDGNATVSILFNSTAKGNFSIYLPRFQKVKINILSGEILSMSSNITNYYFYNMTNISYSPEGQVFSMNISYKFPYASLMISNEAYFISPLIGASDNLYVIAKVFLPNLEKIERSEPASFLVEDGTLTFYLGNMSLGGRVIIVYKLRGSVKEIIVSDSINEKTAIYVRSPLPYRRFSREIISVFKKAAPYFENIFGNLAGSVEFRFFLPEDLGALGYVIGETVNVRGEGPIYLNILLIRYAPGYLETTVLHEYVHIALGLIGVKAHPDTGKLVWFHEAMAQYVSLKVAELMGVDISLISEDLERATRELSPPFTYLKDWCNAGRGAVGECYAAAYYVLKKIAEVRGGLNFIKELVEVIKRKGGVESDEGIIEAFNEAAGEDLTPYFRSWGLSLGTTLRGRLCYIMPYLIAIALSGVIGLTILFMKQVYLDK